MRADLHVHTVYSPDSLLDPARLNKMAVQRKLGCIAVTDHNTMAGALELAKMDLPYRLIPGEEILTQEGEITGLFLKEEIPAGLTLFETIGRIKEQGGLVVLPHPCDRLRRHVLNSEARKKAMESIDLLEGFNGRTVFAKDDAAGRELGKIYDIPLIAGSDCHTAWELGRCGMEMRDFNSVADFMDSIAGASFFGSRAPAWVHLVTKGVKLGNRVGLRKRAAIGG